MFVGIPLPSLDLTGVLEPVSYCFHHCCLVMHFDNWQCQFLPQYSFQILIYSCPFFLLSFDRWSLEWPNQKSWILTGIMYGHELCIAVNSLTMNILHFLQWWVFQFKRNMSLHLFKPFFFNGSIKLCCFLRFCTFLLRIILFLYIFNILYFTYFVFHILRIWWFPVEINFILSDIFPVSPTWYLAFSLCCTSEGLSSSFQIVNSFFHNSWFCCYGFDKYKILCFTLWSFVLIPATPYSFYHNN